MTVIRQKDRDAIIQSLRSGVVPSRGLHHIQVGRKKEIEQFLKDLDCIADGGSTFRLITGEYGAGKTFLLSLVRSLALEKKLITAHADLNPDRRLQSSTGQARSLYAELMRNISTRLKPEGGALAGILEKFISTTLTEAKESGIGEGRALHKKLEHLTEMTNGYDFAAVVSAYWHGYEEGNDQLKANALRWLRGEYSNKTEAKNALGVRGIISDTSFYDQLKLMGRFVRLAGYSGLLVCLDELVNLYKITNPHSRNANYEQILRILNDSLQGTTEGLGFILGGTPEFVTDGRRGLYSYEALKSRLAENKFIKNNNFVDFSGAVILLSRFSQDEFLVLLHNLLHIYASGDGANYLLPEEALQAFMRHCHKQIGDDSFRSPRNTIKEFIDLLATLEQNPTANWETLLGHVKVGIDHGDAMIDPIDDDELVSFKL
jgi:hypothetical protein